MLVREVFLTGATGYVGRQILRELLKERYNVRVLLRRGSEKKLPTSVEAVHIVYGDITDANSLKSDEGGLAGCDAVIHLPGIIREMPSRGITYELVHWQGARNVIEAARAHNVRRFILMSALGVRPDGVSEYQTTKYKAEQYLQESGLDWTIFRPAVIFGHENEGVANFTTVLESLVRRIPFVIPVIGDGECQFQPVALDNVAQGVVKALKLPVTIGKVYEVAGPERYTYNQLIEIIARRLNVKKLKLHLPVWLMMFFASLFEQFEWFPVSRSQIRMLIEGTVSDNYETFFRDFAITPVLFHQT